MDILEEISRRLSIFTNFYDSIRLVDPNNKRVLQCNINDIEISNKDCFAFWGKNSFCENCISMRAYQEMDTVFKIENSKDKIVLVIATPTKVDGNTYIVELLKEINHQTILPMNYLKNEQIKQMIFEINERAIKDEMTGIYNRRYINERLPIDIYENFIKNKSISVIMADIDFFKNVNDNYGHVYGDRILKDFVKLILQNIREKNAWVGRYGGEEFIIILSNTNIDEAYKIAGSIREDVENNIFQYDDVSINITASFGVTEIEGLDLGIDDIFSRVDKNLYQAKQEGRNRACKSPTI